MTETTTQPRRKTLTLEMTGYIMKGVADITLWGGDKACIEMTPVRVRNINEEYLKTHINDAGFGVENINGAICDIYEDYEGTLQYKETITIGEVSIHTSQYYEDNY